MEMGTMELPTTVNDSEELLSSKGDKGQVRVCFGNEQGARLGGEQGSVEESVGVVNLVVVKMKDVEVIRGDLGSAHLSSPSSSLQTGEPK